ncbi:MAG: sialidase family protein [Steroidobacteraceae bacterium]
MLALSRLATALLIALAPLLAHAADTAAANTAVLVNEASHKGQSPEISLGPDGSVHLVWIDENTAPKEHAEHGHSHVAATNLFYARSTDGGTTYSAPLQLNAKDGDVWGFSVSKPRVVVGRNGTVHVFYPGNDVNPGNGKPEAVALYTRSTDGGKTFSKPQRLNTMATTDASELVHGGLTHAHVFGTIVADGKGAVYALWIDTRDMAKASDAGKVFMAVSRDDGKTFGPDKEILPADVCPCCQLTAYLDDAGKLYVGSRQVDHKYRDSTVMVSADGGRSFSPRRRVVGTRWEIEGCPLKPTSIVARGKHVVAAYYTGAENPGGAYVVHSTDGGVNWSTPMLAHPGAVTSDAPVLALAGDVVHLFWHAKTTDGVRRVYTRSSRDLGATFGAVSELPAPPGATQLPAIAGRADGSVHVAWQQGAEVRAMRWVAAN